MAFFFSSQPEHHTTFCECPKRLTIPWSHTFLCVVVPNTNHLVSRAVLIQAIAEWNALFKILPPKTFYFNIKTQYKRKPSIFYVFCSHMASDGIITLVLLDLFRLHTERPALLPLLHRLILWNSPVTDISSVDAVCKSLTPASSFSTISRHRWKWLKILFFSDSGGEVDAWRKSFSRLPIRTIRNPIVKSDFLFSSITESHWSHWSVLETTDWEKDEWVQCFPLWSVTIH